MGSGSCDPSHGLISCLLLLRSHLGGAGSGSRSSCREAGGLLAVIAPHNAASRLAAMTLPSVFYSRFGLESRYIGSQLDSVPPLKSQFPLRIIDLRSNFAKLVQVSPMAF